MQKLPNGWKYSLSHQRYESADGTCHEGRGVPVDVKAINTRQEVNAGKDVVVSKALEILAKDDSGDR